MATVEKGQPTAVPDTERDPNYGQGKDIDQSETDRIIKGDKVELQDSDAWECLGYSFKTWRKWQILIVVFFIQISINTNASMYSHGVSFVHEQYGVSEQVARVPQALFLIAYGFGCELWAPWSEEYGRWPIQQLSLFLVNLWQIPCALSKNYATILIFRILGGLSTAGGSVTLGVLADMWEPDEQEYAVAFLVLSSVGGSVVGAIIGAFVEARMSLPWIFWVQLIMGGAVQAIHFFCNPETRSTILLDREAKRRRKSGEDPNIYGPNEIRGGHKISAKECATIFWRPFYMFFTEPIVLWLSLLSGFSDALIFTFLEGFKPVYSQWRFGVIQLGLAFVPILIGYFLAYLSYMPSIIKFRRKRKQSPGSVAPEARLWWLLFLAPLEFLGMMGFAWTSLGPEYGIPWIAPMLFTVLVAMANYAIYQSSIDYQTAAYGPYAASATGGNDLARDFMAGVAALYSTPLYKNIPGRPVQYASTVLSCLAVVVTIPIYIVYWKGPEIRSKSKFAQSLDKTREERTEKSFKIFVVRLKSLDNIDMSEFDAPPPNTHAGGNDNALRTKGNDPMTAPVEYADERINMEEYERTVPLWKRVWQHSLTQLLLLSVQAFCGPAMADAIAGLGGGGLATPQTSNIATAINYSMLALCCALGGPIVNKLGTKWSLVIGACSFPIRGSSYYCNSKFGNQWYLILGGFFTGIGTGTWYVAESGTIMSLAPSNSRGKYLALWIVARNLGQLVGGAINLSKNHIKGANGGVTPDTYIAFLIIECMALPFAFLISPLERVVRSDGTRILVSEKLSTKTEFKMIKVTMTSKLILLSALWAIWSFFYSGTWSTYLGTYFSVRARALSSLVSPFFCIVGCFALGFVLDMKTLSQRRRAQAGLFIVVILNLGVYIWSIVMQARFNSNNPGKIDWEDALYARSFLPYFFVQTTGPLSQSYMYWLLSSFATDAQANVRNGAAFRCLEAVGQAISYGMNTQIKTSPLIGFCVTFALMAVAFGPMLMLVNQTPDRIPADVIAEEQERAESKVGAVNVDVKA